MYACVHACEVLPSVSQRSVHDIASLDLDLCLLRMLTLSCSSVAASCRSSVRTCGWTGTNLWLAKWSRMSSADQQLAVNIDTYVYLVVATAIASYLRSVITFRYMIFAAQQLHNRMLRCVVRLAPPRNELCAATLDVAGSQCTHHLHPYPGNH